MIDKKAYNTYSLLKKMAIILLLVISAGWIPYNYFTAPPPRFCEEKNRVLTNEEFIIAALEERYKYNKIKTDDSTKTPQDFYGKYPDCCIVGSRPRMLKRNFMGDLYDVNQGHIGMTLFYPRSEEDLARPIMHFDGKETRWYVDKTLAYTKSSFQMSDCGGVGKSIEKNLSIKDTPFAKL